MSLLSTDASFNSLALICTFLSENPKDAILTFGPVCRRWHEVMTTQCRDMWKNLTFKTFPKLHRTCNTYHEFVTIASRFSLPKSFSGTRPQYHPNARNIPTQLLDIENCVNTQTDDDKDSSSSIDFSFTCPVLAQNLHRLDNETTEDGLPVFSCDICKKKVYTIQDSEKLEQAANLGRCVRISEAAADRFRENSHFMSTNGHGRVNIGFVVGNEEQEKLVFDSFRRCTFAQKMLRFEEDDNCINRSRNILEFNKSDTRPHHWRLQLVRKFKNNNSDKNNSDDDSEDPLSDKNAPVLGGWNFLIVFPGVELQQGSAETNTGQLKALQQSKRVFYFEEKNPSQTHLLGLDLKNQSKILPEENFGLFWQVIESHIIDLYRPPKYAFGNVAYIRNVRMAGLTIPAQNEDDERKKKTREEMMEAKKSETGGGSSWCSSQ